MSRYIEVDKLIKDGWKLRREKHGLTTISFETMELDCVPTADVRKNVHGEWIEDGYQGYPCVCSICGITQEIKAKFLFSFCPNCGADMRKGVEE